MNKNKQQQSLKALTIAVLLFSIPMASAGLYRWIDSSGKVHFSDKIPPAMAQKGHSELSQNGVETKKVLSAEKLKQIEVEKEAMADEKQQLALHIEKAKNEQIERKKHDQYLQSTFDSKDELVKYFEEKISTLSGTANILIARNESLTKKVKRLNSKLKVSKSQKIKDSLKFDVEEINRSITQYEKALGQNEKELLALKKQYENDLKRYVELASK